VETGSREIDFYVLDSQQIDQTQVALAGGTARTWGSFRGSKERRDLRAVPGESEGACGDSTREMMESMKPG
jgi:hypothetical protein